MKRYIILHVKKGVVEKNPALLASVDFEEEDYSVFRDVLVLTETSELVRVLVKGQEFWLSKPHIRIE